MTLATITREEAVLRQLRRQYERQGYQFFEHPRSDLVPSFLGNYVPDAIAIGPHDNVVLEVKASRAPSREKLLSELAARMKGQNEWKLRVIYAPDDGDDDLIPVARPSELKDAVREVGALIDSQHLRAASVMTWGLLEAVARRLAPAADTGDIRSPREVVEWLTHEGYISQSASRRLREIVPLRNAVVHGDFSKTISAEDVSFVLSEVDRLVAALEQEDSQPPGG